MFRGREQAHPERGRALLQKLFEDLDGLAVIESAPLQEGRNMSMLLAPSKEVDKLRRRRTARRRPSDAGRPRPSCRGRRRAAEADAAAEADDAAADA